METKEFTVSKISCAGCAKAIENALRRVDGVASVTVAVPEKRVRVGYDAGKTGEVALRTALEKAGYPPAP